MCSAPTLDETSPLITPSVGGEETPAASGAPNGGTWPAKRLWMPLVVALVMCSFLMSLMFLFPYTRHAPLTAKPSHLQNTVASTTRPQVIELAQFSLVEGTSNLQFLSAAKALEPFFSETQDTVQRSLLCNRETGVWSDIVYWTSMAAALQAADDIIQLPAAQQFLQFINFTTLQLKHAYIEVDWISPIIGQLEFGESVLKVELAAFPLKPHVSAHNFTAQAKATKPFFRKIDTAVHRILAQGDNNTTWYDIVYWTSLSAALDAAQAIEHIPASRPFLDSIDDKSVEFEFTYSDLLLEQQFK